MSRKISSFSMNLYSTRRRDGGIVPTVQLDMIFATQRTSIAAVHGAMTVDGLLPCTGVKEGYFKPPDSLGFCLHYGLMATLRASSL